MKLNKVQERTYKKLETKKYLTAYDLQETIATLRALVSKGLAESKSEVGCLWSPRTSIGFRRKEIK